jgi:hypothetical protein
MMVVSYKRNLEWGGEGQRLNWWVCWWCRIGEREQGGWKKIKLWVVRWMDGDKERWRARSEAAVRV